MIPKKSYVCTQLYNTTPNTSLVLCQGEARQPEPGDAGGEARHGPDHGSGAQDPINAENQGDKGPGKNYMYIYIHINIYIYMYIYMCVCVRT